ncbi:proteasome subunit beta [Pseudomonas viridiflava]|uniref:proteasome subunit beta n=2 Tax=Pseudomonas viridiflava TaxID=33069 RepID=UPI000F02950E|nr:proteasome subunit beta [Pseudomonas viridiflava]
MTTIAYKDGVIAYDSQITSGNTITYDDYEKCHEVKGVKFVMSGKTSDYEHLQSAWFGAPVTRNLDAAAIVFDGERLWYIGADTDSGFWKCPVSGSGTYAIGSGADHALTAMDMGATSGDAVEMAKKRDTGTGGQVRLLVILNTGEKTTT